MVYIIIICICISLYNNKVVIKYIKILKWYFYGGNGFIWLFYEMGIGGRGLLI